MPWNNNSDNRSYTAELIRSGGKADLHIHTFYSDGKLSPEAVVDRWISEGYDTIAITDHDGIEGSIKGMEYAYGKGVTFIPGIEFDSSDELGKDIHVLGYGIDYNNKDLRSVLRDLIIKRARRNDAMMAALNDRGCGITLDEIGEMNEGRYVGKPTFASILVKKGIVGTNDEAFNTLFREPELRKIRKETLSSEKVVDVIHQAGGLAVLAHPMEQRHLGESFKDFRPRLYAILDRMREYGVDGIECFHPSADPERAELLCEYAEQNGLIITRGSDFHSDSQKRNFARYHGE